MCRRWKVIFLRAQLVGHSISARNRTEMVFLTVRNGLEMALKETRPRRRLSPDAHSDVHGVLASNQSNIQIISSPVSDLLNLRSPLCCAPPRRPRACGAPRRSALGSWRLVREVQVLKYTWRVSASRSYWNRAPCATPAFGPAPRCQTVVLCLGALSELGEE